MYLAVKADFWSTVIDRTLERSAKLVTNNICVMICIRGCGVLCRTEKDVVLR